MNAEQVRALLRPDGTMPLLRITVANVFLVGIEVDLDRYLGVFDVRDDHRLPIAVAAPTNAICTYVHGVTAAEVTIHDAILPETWMTSLLYGALDQVDNVLRESTEDQLPP
jgi:hypothetical protein